MKIAIPSESDTGLESMRSGHFGHAPYFTIITYTEDMDIANVDSVKNVDHDAVGCGGVIAALPAFHQCRRAGLFRHDRAECRQSSSNVR